MLKQRLATEQALQPLVAQYVPLELDVRGQEFAAWARMYPPAESGIPMLFIVSSDGKDRRGKIVSSVPQSTLQSPTHDPAGPNNVTGMMGR